MSKPNKTIAVLFAHKESIYKNFPELDVYDKERNFINYPGGMPIIAHPPCRAWGRLRAFANPLPEEKWFAKWSVDQIRKFGGVLEHPSSSILWKEKKLPSGNETDKWGGWTLSVDQSWFGHKSRKSTLLYIVGCDRKNIPDFTPSRLLM